MERLIDSFLDYLKYERNYSVHTVLAYSEDLSQFADYLSKNHEKELSPDIIDSDIARGWIVHLTDSQMSASSVKRKLSSLKSFFKFLVKQNVVYQNPVRFLTGPKKKRSIPYFINESAMNGLLNSDYEEGDFEEIRDRLIVEMLYDTGIRCSELTGISNVDIDYSASLIKVTGKRNKQRLIPFGERLEKLMKAYAAVRNREVEQTNSSFFVRKNGLPVSADVVYTIVHKKLSEIPMLAKRSPHVLRHSFATGMLNNGAKLNTVKELLGHSSLASTEVYTHTTFEELKKMYHAHPRAKKEGGFYGH